MAATKRADDGGAAVSFLSTVTSSGRGFTARYRSGAASSDFRVAQFYLAMEDRGANARAVRAYISAARHMDFETDWAEASRILDTFENAKPKRRARKA